MTLKLLVVGACITFATSLLADEDESQTPVLLVRGIASRDQVLRPLQNVLNEHRFTQVDIVAHESYLGEDSLKDVAREIHQAALKLRKQTKARRIDIVAFSMGALSTRYMIQRMGGKHFVRKFVSISGPHHGTYTAFLPQFLTGISEMRPGSELIDDLSRDEDAWGNVEVYSFYTPYDLIVFPGDSGILKGSVEVKRFEVALHHQMLKHRDVLTDVVRVLRHKPTIQPIETPPLQYVSQ